jgi:hypothetical protein
MRFETDAKAATAAMELVIRKPLPDYDLEEVEARVAREVDPVLASQGFKDLLDEARGTLEAELAGSGLEIAQLTGAICHEGAVYRPGIWLVLREAGAAAGRAMSAAAQEKARAAGEAVEKALQMA